MACFADINVSQGSVATCATCGGMFNMHLTANLRRNLSVKKNCKSVKIWQNYGHKSVAPFFGPPCMCRPIKTGMLILCLKAKFLGLGIVRPWPWMLWPWHKSQGHLPWYMHISNAISSCESGLNSNTSVAICEVPVTVRGLVGLFISLQLSLLL